MECGKCIWIIWLVYIISDSLATKNGPSDSTISQRTVSDLLSGIHQLKNVKYRPRALPESEEMQDIPAAQHHTNNEVRRVKPPSPSFSRRSDNDVMYPPFFQNPWVRWGLGIANSVARRTSTSPWSRASPIISLWEEFYRNTPYANNPGYGQQFYGGYGQFPPANGPYSSSPYESFPGNPSGRYLQFNQQPYRNQPLGPTSLQQPGQLPYRESTVPSLSGSQNFRETPIAASNVRPVPDGTSATRLNSEQPKKSNGQGQSNATFTFKSDSPIELDD